MTTSRKLLLIGALLATAAPSFAQDAHHPDTAADAAPPAASLAPSGPPAMAGPGMMSGMMSGMMPGMMSGGMMGPNMMSMMSMLASMGQMMAPEHVEGRLAFLRTELGITEAQQPLWDAFAEALRANARGIAGTMANTQGTMPAPSAAPLALPQRIELQERMLTARLDGLRQASAALGPLYAALDDAQKRTFDTLLMVGPMGLM